MQVPTIALKVRRNQPAKLVDLGTTVFGGMTGNVNFSTPLVPLANLQTAITDVQNAIALWGPKGNRGSHANYLDLQNKCVVLHQMLKSQAQYVTAQSAIIAGNDYSEMASIMASSGFELKTTGHPQGVLGQVQDLRKLASAKVNRNQVKLKWARPLGVTSKNNVKSYKVYRANTVDFMAALQVATVTKSEFLDTNNTTGVVNWTYWIVAVGAAGDGLVSEPITISLLNA